MFERLHHLGIHFRRHSIGYIGIALALSLSPVPSMAADLVTTGQIANGAVTQPKLAADSVVSGKILNETIVGADIKNGGVGTLDINDGTLSGTDIKDGGIGGADIADGSIGNDDISDGTIGSADIANLTVGGADIADSAVGMYHIATGAVGTGEVADGSVGGIDIADGSITGEDINLFDDNQCEGETVQGTAFVDPKNVGTHGSYKEGLSWVHSCSGGQVEVWREATGVYTIYFERNPARLAVVSMASCCFATVENFGPGKFAVTTLNHLGGVEPLVDGFSILIY